MKSHVAPNYVVGSILWLPPKAQIPSEHRLEADAIEEGCFNHPVLIISVNQAKTEVVILIITSFGGKDLQERHPRDTRARSLHLPIYPSNAHPDNGSLLFLTGDNRLSRNSYVKIERQRIVRAALIRPTRRPTCVLRPDSLKELFRLISFESPWKDVEPVRHVRNPPPVRQALAKPARYVPTQMGAWDTAYVIDVQPARADVHSGYAHRPDERTSLLRPTHRTVRARGDAYRICLFVIQLVLLVGFAVIVAVCVITWGGWMRLTRRGRRV